MSQETDANRPVSPAIAGATAGKLAGIDSTLIDEQVACLGDRDAEIVGAVARHVDRLARAGKAIAGEHPAGDEQTA